MKYCYYNGRILPENKARISLNDIGFLRCYAVFEIFRTYNRKPFLFKEHLARFRNSAEALHLKFPFVEKKLLADITRLLKKNGLADGVVKTILTGGESEDGLNCNYNRPNAYILVKKLPKYSPAIYQQGVKINTFEHQRELPSVKTNNYLTMVKLQKLRLEQAAAETLYVWKSLALEGATSNFFIFKGDILITAKDSILSGITRNFVIKLAKKRFRVQERDVKFNEIKQADEAFITSATREIWPVVKIDKNKIGDGRVGKNTKILMDLFKEYTDKY